MLTAEEYAIQSALGTLPDKYKTLLVRGRQPQVCKRGRTCHLCGGKIHKGEEFYWVFKNTMNIHIDCSYIPFSRIRKMEEEENATKDG